MSSNQEMDIAALFAVFSETTSQPQSTVAAAATHNVGHKHDKEEAKRQIQERNRLESSWYRGWMATRGSKYIPPSDLQQLPSVCL